MARIDHAAIAERAREQLGLITAAQLAELGTSRRQVDRLVAEGVLGRAARGVLALSGAPSTARQRLLAATLALGDGAVASHRAAAWLWDFDGVEPEGIELSVRRGRGAAIDGGVVHRVRALDAVDVARLGAQALTTPARTLVDLAAVVPTGVLEEALDDAFRRGQVQPAFLRWRIEALRRPGVPGVSELERLLPDARQRARAESWLESAFLRLLRDAFLPIPRIQVSMRPDGGERVRLDAFYDDERLVAEVGGHATHATRRQRQADAERRARLVAAGLRVIDFTYEDVTERPDYVASTIARLLGLVPYGLGEPAT